MFPDPRDAPHDVIAFGTSLEPSRLIEAYRKGIFPWPMDEILIPWFSPRIRAILEFDRIHVSRSLRRARRISSWRFSIDEDFEGVIRACSEIPRPGQDGTWITAEMIDAYRELHELGHAHSVEVWNGRRLVGGIYGVDAGGSFGGESMFFREPNASKLALLHLVDHLRSRGLDWIDIQVMTPHMANMGAINVFRASFLDRLAKELRLARRLFD